MVSLFLEKQDIYGFIWSLNQQLSPFINPQASLNLKVVAQRISMHIRIQLSPCHLVHSICSMSNSRQVPTCITTALSLMIGLWCRHMTKIVKATQQYTFGVSQSIMPSMSMCFAPMTHKVCAPHQATLKSSYLQIGKSKKHFQKDA